MTIQPEDPEKEPNAEKKQGPKKEDVKSKLSDTFENLKKNENIESIITYAQNNVQHTIAFALMLVGILWFFVHGFYGGLIIGLVAGFYFSKEVLHLIKSYNEVVKEHGVAKSLVFAGLAFALFIAAPGIFFGAAIMVGLKVMLKAD